MTRGLTLETAFHARVPNRPEGECWDWDGPTKHGYGEYRRGVGEKRWRATHLSLLFLRGETVPSGSQVNHTCDRPICVNPDHLYIGSHRQNMDDAVARKRMGGNGGVRNGMRLTDEQVIEMRAAYQAGERQTALAARYGVSQANVSLIVRGEAWVHLLPPT
jgi:hypothetical protein